MIYRFIVYKCFGEVTKKRAIEPGQAKACQKLFGERVIRENLTGTEHGESPVRVRFRKNADKPL